MSTDIDIKNYSGEVLDDSAAVNQQQVDTNSYLNELQDAPLPQPAKEGALEAQPLAQEPIANPQSENFRLLREEVDRLKAERAQEKRDYQAQIEMLRVNTPQRQVEPEKPRKMFDNLPDDDVPSVKDIRNEWQTRESAYQSRLDELEFQVKHSDYHEVIEKYAKPLANSDPFFIENLRRSVNPAQYAYSQGKYQQRLHEAESLLKTQQTQQANPTAQRIVDNARKPGTLAQAGGQSVLSQADYFASMSDAEFMKMANKNLEGI